MARKPGTIVRLKLHNFMTYEDTEIFPQPGLNVIIGPNGSGKSSILGAICVVLGGNHSTIVRGSSIGGLIRMNSTGRCYIEIELYEKEGENICIIREISRTNQTSWFISRKKTTKEEIMKILSRYNIDVNNLCQFLPQDKVSHFAGLSSVELLKETEATIDPSLHQLHQQIIEGHESLDDNLKNHQKNQDELKRLDGKINELEEKLKESQFHRQMKDQVYLLEGKSLILLNSQLMNENVKKKKELDKKIQVKTILEDIIVNYEDDRDNVLKQKLDQLRNNRKYAKHYLMKSTTEFSTACSDLEDIRSENSTINRRNIINLKMKNRLNVEKNELLIELTRVKELSKKKKEKIDHLQVECEQKKEEFQTRSNKINSAQTIIRNKEEKLTSMKYQKSIAKTSLESKEKQLLERLKANHSHVFQARRFIKDPSNHHLFKGPIYGPIMTEIDIVTEKAATYLETHIPLTDLLMFITTNIDDYNSLNRKIRDEMKLAINVTCVENYEVEKYQKNVENVKWAFGDELKSMGFNYIMNELIKTSIPEVMVFLCDVHNIHKTPISLQELQLSNETENLINKNTPVYYCGSQCYRAQISRYQTNKLTQVYNVKYSRFLHFLPTLELKQKVSDRIRDISEQQELLEVELMKLKEDHLTANEQFQQFEDEFKKQQDELALLKSNEIRVNKLEHSHKQIEERLKNTEMDIKEGEKELKEITLKTIHNLKLLEKRYDRLMRNRIHSKIYESFAKVLDRMNIGGTIDNSTVIKIKQHIMKTNNEIVELKNVVRNNERTLLTNGERLDELDFPHNINRLKKNLKKKYDEISNDYQEICLILKNTLIQQQVTGNQNGNLEELQSIEIMERDLLQFKTDEKELRGIFDKGKSEIDELNKTHKNRVDEWKKRLNKIIEDINHRFNELFSFIRCTGQIKLEIPDNPNNFKIYGINILVKFRANETITKLNKFTQSGGEKAVSTMLYILSLQQFSESPIRCVDEINQGMDSENEKDVYNLIVDICEKKKDTQYFLFTPKLLTNLNFHLSTNFIVVLSGRHNLPHKVWKKIYENYQLEKY
ncbi:hypothetical protein SNEBB_007365 [Seison nebaliae]|nr:hypothetical protein SNEBB_007365 [Seison nebaliae]